VTRHLLVEYLKEKKVPLIGVLIVSAIASAVLFGVVTGVLTFFFGASLELAMLLAGSVVTLMLIALCIMACMAVNIELQVLERTFAAREDKTAPAQ